jgi:hypothetical protein
MKIHQLHFQRNLLLVFSLGIFLFSCKKDFTPEKAVSASSNDAFVTDNLVTIESSITSTVTPQSFIANGSTSQAAFQITASQYVKLTEGFFSGTYPAIQYITSPNIGVAVSHNGQMGLVGLGILSAGTGITLPVEVNYAPVDSSTSGTVAQLSFTGISYTTNDGIDHDFTPKTPIKAQSMCLVNNIPHILLDTPTNSSLANNYHQIARIILTGDTSWILNSLPLTLWAQYNANIPLSKLIVKNGGNTLTTTSQSIQLGTNSRAQTVINFSGGFTHPAGSRQILNVYAKTPTIGSGINQIITTVNPLSSFVWTDGLGVKIPGSKNNQYYKEQTGQVSFYQQ